CARSYGTNDVHVHADDDAADVRTAVLLLGALRAAPQDNEVRFEALSLLCRPRTQHGHSKRLRYARRGAQSQRRVSLGVFARLGALPRVHSVSIGRVGTAAARRIGAADSTSEARFWRARARADRKYSRAQAFVRLRRIVWRHAQRSNVFFVELSYFWSGWAVPPSLLELTRLTRSWKRGSDRSQAKSSFSLIVPTKGRCTSY